MPDSPLIALVYPDYREGSVYRNTGLPTGLGYIAQSLLAAGHAYAIIDLNYKDLDDLQTVLRISTLRFLGVSMMSYHCSRVYEWLQAAKQEFPLVTIVAGGPHVTAMREVVLRDCSAIDVGVVGEGERTLTDILSGTPPHLIPGVIYRDGHDVRFTGERDFVNDLDDIPFPTYKGFDLDQYGAKMVISSSRGCPYKCIFCGAPRILGRQWRARSAKSMCEEVMYWHARGVHSFFINDSNFAVNKRRVVEFCDLLIGSGTRQTIGANGLRADHVDGATLRKMREAGFDVITFGVESGSERVLMTLKKGETVAQIERAIALATHLGFHVTLFFLLGSPGETVSDIKKSFRLARKYGVAVVYFFVLTPIPGTEYFDWMIEQGLMVAGEGRYPEGNFGFGAVALRATDCLTETELSKWVARARVLEGRVRWVHAFKTRVMSFRSGKALHDSGMLHAVAWHLSHPFVLRSVRRALKVLSSMRRSIRRAR